MKKLIVVLALSIGVLVAQDAPIKVVVTDGNTPLLRAIAADKHCAGWTVDRMFSHSKLPLPQWVLFQSVGDGHGGFQVWLSPADSQRYTFLGSNFKRGVRKACDIMNGKRQPVWMSVSSGSDAR